VSRPLYPCSSERLADGTRNKIKLAAKLATEYKDVQTLPPILAGQQAGPAGPKRPAAAGPAPSGGQGVKLIGGPEGSSYVKSID
jgi:pleiotropic regulator 1